MYIVLIFSVLDCFFNDCFIYVFSGAYFYLILHTRQRSEMGCWGREEASKFSGRLVILGSYIQGCFKMTVVG